MSNVTEYLTDVHKNRKALLFSFHGKEDAVYE